jgi:hypothetical protein
MLAAEVITEGHCSAALPDQDTEVERSLITVKVSTHATIATAQSGTDQIGRDAIA